ncbi:MAG TPA: LysR substrate-binding domain-containing protein [Dermatophilaceae bacterium]|nr:LysR substrate-binding domain-containing protein [Dermatophilaceae bacterium]
MNLRELEYLVAVADHEHFGRAADACGVSQPTLSTQLKRLEEELGVQLVERSPRLVVLTAAGEDIVARARQVLADVEAIRDVARHAVDPRAGTLRLGAFPTIAPYLLPHVIDGLATWLPNLELLLVEERSSTLVDELREGRLDAAVLALPIEDQSLVVEPLFREPFVLAAPATHRLARDRGPVPVDALAGERVLLLADGHCLRDHALSVCRAAGSAVENGFRATSLETLRHMVGSGVGVTLLPLLAVSPPVAPSDRVVTRRFADPEPSRDIALVWRRTTPYAHLLAEVATILRDLPPGLVVPLAGTPAPG